MKPLSKEGINMNKQKSGTYEGVVYKGVTTWRPATPLPYFPSLWEKIGHKLGIHQWTYQAPFKCVMCGKKKDL